MTEEKSEVTKEVKAIEKSFFDDPDTSEYTFWIKNPKDNPMFMKLKLSEVRFEGHLFKKSSKSDFWKSRYFRLYYDRLNLHKNGRDKEEVSTMLLANVKLDLRSQVD